MIRMEQVTKVYETTKKVGWFKKERQNKVAVSGLSLELQPGEIIGLLGLNGAGKTTTIKMLSTLLDPTSGTITIDGLDVVKQRQAIQARVNMIAGGERMLYWRLTGRENLHYFGRIYGLPETVVRERTESLLQQVGLAEAADTPVEQYSKGMKQRLQIARGLINDPKYLFLDEPTLGLDAPIARQLRALVKSLADLHGKGILLTSHYLPEVEELCDRVYVINRGELILMDTPESVVQKVAGYQQLLVEVEGWRDELWAPCADHLHVPRSAVTVQVDGANASQRLTVKTESTDRLIPQLLPWLVERGVQIRGMATEKPTLEDAILLLSEGGGEREPQLASISR